VERTVQRMAFPFTFLFKCEGDQWAALACEVDVASCGDTLEEARENLKDAVEVYVFHMLDLGRAAETARPVSEEALREFATDSPGQVTAEYHTLLVSLGTVGPTLEFVRSMVAPTSCQSLVSAG